MDDMLQPSFWLAESENFTDFPTSFSSLLTESPGLAVPYIIVLGIIAVIGTFGNFMIIGTLTCGGRGGCGGVSFLLQCCCCGGAGVRGGGGAGLVGLVGGGGSGGYAVGNLFITNLACSDFIVTAVINPFAIIGVTHGYQIYVGRQWLCTGLASICVISCVVSLLTVGCISVNRYVFICHQSVYRFVYTRCHSYLIVASIWVVGVLMDLPSHVGWSKHEYDAKSHKCLWSRSHAHSYTVFFVLVGMLVPLAIITVCYALIFKHIREAKQKIQRLQTNKKSGYSSILKTIRQVRTMFIIFASFSVCWAPYIIVLLSDSTDSFPMYIHLYASLVAHLHASVNFAIYGLTNNVIRAGYQQFVRQRLCCAPPPSANTMSTAVSGSVLLKNDHDGHERTKTGGRGRGGRGTAKVSDDELSAIRFISVAFPHHHRTVATAKGNVTGADVALQRLQDMRLEIVLTSSASTLVGQIGHDAVAHAGMVGPMKERAGEERRVVIVTTTKSDDGHGVSECERQEMNQQISVESKSEESGRCRQTVDPAVAAVDDDEEVLGERRLSLAADSCSDAGIKDIQNTSNIG